MPLRRLTPNTIGTVPTWVTGATSVTALMFALG